MASDILHYIEALFLQNKDPMDLIRTSIFVWRSGGSIAEIVRKTRERGYNKRLYAFLLETNKATDQQRLAFLKDLKENQDEFWEKILLHLDQIDSEEKARISGKLVEALILKFIDREMLHRLYLIIRTTYIADLILFNEKYRNAKPISGEIVIDIDEGVKDTLEHLVVSGLLKKTEKGLMILDTRSSQLEYQPTAAGKALLKYGF